MPRVTSFSDLRAHLKAYCDEVAADGEPLIVTRRGAEDVALISVKELVALEETAHLLRSPKNARRLLESTNETRSGHGTLMTMREVHARYGLDE